MVGHGFSHDGAKANPSVSNAGYRCLHDLESGRDDARSLSKHEAFVVSHAVLLQEQNIFFFECLFLVMLPLVPDVTDRIFNLGRADAECAIAFLPEAVS